MVPSSCISWNLIVTSIILVRVEGHAYYRGLGHIPDRIPRFNTTFIDDDRPLKPWERKPSGLVQDSSNDKSDVKKHFRSAGRDSAMSKSMNSGPGSVQQNDASESDWLKPVRLDKNVEDISWNLDPGSRWDSDPKNYWDVDSESTWDSASGSRELDSGNGWNPEQSKNRKSAPSNSWKPVEANDWDKPFVRSTSRPDTYKIPVRSRVKVTPQSKSFTLLGGWNGPNVIGDWDRPRVNSGRQMRIPAVR